jgi:parallel beta-helix repeat protein
MSLIKRAIAGGLIVAAIGFFASNSAAGEASVPMVLVGARKTLTITKPGSYYLPRNLVSALTNAPVVLVTASNVTLNLNGYSIIGPGGSGTASAGILANPSVANVTVVGGTIAGIAGAAVNLGPESEVSGMHIVGNSGDGVDCASACLVSGNIIADNGGVGISLSDSSSGFQNNVLNGNAGGIVGGTSLGHNLVNGSPD